MSISKYAKYDPAHVSDGLFVPTKGRKQGNIPRLDVQRDWAGGIIRFLGPYALTVEHQSILLAACARANRCGSLTVYSGPGYQLGLPNVLPPTVVDLNGKNHAEGQDIATVDVTMSQLLMDAGLAKGGWQVKDLKTRIIELGAVTVYRQIGRNMGHAPLMGWSGIEGGALRLYLNWRLANAVLGGGQYVLISLDERRMMQDEVGKLLHCWVSSFVRRGQVLRVTKTNLLQHIWGNDKIADRTAYKRLKRVNAALTMLDKLDSWTVIEDDKCVEIERNS